MKWAWRRALKRRLIAGLVFRSVQRLGRRLSSVEDAVSARHAAADHRLIQTQTTRTQRDDVALDTS